MIYFVLQNIFFCPHNDIMTKLCFKVCLCLVLVLVKDPYVEMKHKPCVYTQSSE